jgi:hypothetical protein
MVKLWCSAFDRIRVPARPAQHVHRRVFQTCDAGRARVYLPSEAGTPDMTIGHADADHAGARPYLRRRAERLGPIISRVAHLETTALRSVLF